MTKEEAIKRLKEYAQYSYGIYHNEEKDEIAFDMAIEALEQIESGRYIKGECSICSKEFGTLGCCTTVSNHWVYSCKEGMAQYAEALQQEPSCRNPRQVDLISKQNAVNEIHKYFAEEIDKTPTELDKDGNEVFADMPTVNSLLACNKDLSKRIKSLPSADRPKGHWIETASEYYGMINEKGGGVDENTPYFTDDDIACSECLAKFSVIDNETERFDFCPNCGSYNGSEKGV